MALNCVACFIFRFMLILEHLRDMKPRCLMRACGALLARRVQQPLCWLLFFYSHISSLRTASPWQQTRHLQTSHKEIKCPHTRSRVLGSWPSGEQGDANCIHGLFFVLYVDAGLCPPPFPAAGRRATQWCRSLFPRTTPCSPAFSTECSRAARCVL